MNTHLTEVIFWIFFLIIFYTYIGYGLLLMLVVKLFRPGRRDLPVRDEKSLPTVSVVIAAYNEEDFIREKAENLKALNYPAGKLEIVFVTDGSDDRTNEILAEIPGIRIFFEPARKGKTAAINRIMPLIKSDITVFNDANTLINQDAVLLMVRHFLQNEKVAAVAGEKRVITNRYDTASAAGEGMYWKYESYLKKLDSRLYSAMGAAGELFAIRTNLYNYPATNIIIEDFYVTLKTTLDGCIIRYEPGAYAAEKSSASVREELKRKVRIAAGGIQAILLLPGLLNIFKRGWLPFQYISHRVLRWTLTPLLIPLLLILNTAIMLHRPAGIYHILLFGQLLFYFFGLIGLLLQSRNLKFRVFFIPYYFMVMNYAVYAGLIRFLKGKQSAVWERARRAS